MIGVGHHQKSDDARDRQEECKFDRAILRRAGAGFVAGGDPVRHLRDQHGADGNADDADRQLIDAVGVIERRDRAGRQEARDDGVGEQRELRAGRADGRRHQRGKEAADIAVEAQLPKHREYAGAHGIAADQRGLQHARNQDAPCRRVAGAAEERGKRQRRHHRYVEQDRRRCRARRTDAAR